MRTEAGFIVSPEAASVKVDRSCQPVPVPFVLRVRVLPTSNLDEQNTALPLLIVTVVAKDEILPGGNPADHRLYSVTVPGFAAFQKASGLGLGVSAQRPQKGAR